MSDRRASDEASNPRVAAVVLAAGRARRMGGAKLLLPVGGIPMVRRVVDAALRSRVSETIVVVGHEAQGVRAALDGLPVRVVANADYARGMSSSLRAGLAAVDATADGALILLGDQPFVSAALLDQLIDRFGACGKPVVRPALDGRPANPVLVGAALFPELMRERGDVGGRRVVERRPEDVCLVPVDDPRQLVDVDSPEQYAKERDG